MVISSRNYEVFIKAAKRHNLKPLIREISSFIGGKPVTLYEAIGLDKVTEFILQQEMEEIQGESKL